MGENRGLADDWFIKSTTGRVLDNPSLNYNEKSLLIEALERFQQGTIKAPESGSILQDWVAGLGLRHQGTLLTAVRGCDTAPKNDPSKMFTRCLRGVILRAHCGDPKKAATFIEACSPPILVIRFDAFRKDLDHYPHHYVMHLIHAIEIIGFKMPEQPLWSADGTGNDAIPIWEYFYRRLCKGLHITPETESELDERLNADEATFAARD